MDTSKIFFEYCEPSNTCVLRQDNYNSRLDKLMFMFGVAKEDFPLLEYKDITIKVYGGNRRKGQPGIEFEPPSPVPTKYERINTLELTLN